ncbi:hypothetical protein V1264_004287 [Littorina saxatilis]|uniref:Receptor ligand binding region domain-containing protein n=1 Tax=Littorina saxatilis TaxID=31220 RepID=A0AAN9B1R6_9CAEN
MKTNLQALFLLLCCLQLCTAQDDVTILPGNVTIATIFNVNDLENGACGDYDVSDLQSLVAVTWFVEELNRMNYVPGITIGLEAYRTCKKPEMATQGAVKLFEKYGVLSGNAQQDGVLFALLGPSRTADALPVSSLIGSLPANQRVLQISGSATGRQLSDHSAHPSFFRVIPSDQTQVQVMIRLMLQLQWNYVAIVYDDDDYGRSAATELRRLAEKHQVCVPVFVSLPVDARSSAFVKQAKNISQQLRSTMNGLVRGLVVLGATSTTQKLLRIISSDIAFVSVILSEAVDLNRATLLTSGGQVSAVSAGALVTSPPFIDLPELKPLWNDLWSNGTSFLEQAGKIPWLGEYFTQLSSCSADDSTTCWSQAETQRQIQKVSEEAEVPLYVGYQVKAVAVMVTLLKHLQEEKCGSASSGLCSGLVTTISQRTGIIETLEDSTLNVSNLSAVSDVFKGLTSVRFSGSSSSLLSDGAKGDYTVFNFRRPEKQGDFNFEQIGSWLNNNLTINTSRAQFYDETLLPLTWSQLPPAQCDVDHDCLKCERDVSGDVIFMEGDFYIVAILLANDKTQADPLACGKIRTALGADIVQSVVFCG